VAVEVEQGRVGERLLLEDARRLRERAAIAERREILEEELADVATRVGPEDC
jgi:hypothetical protein